MSTPKDQFAAVVPHAKATVTLKNRPVPRPIDDQLLVKIAATAINPVDWKIQSGSSTSKIQFPIILGSDAAGTVVSVGPKARGYAIGDRVFFQGFRSPDQATFQQYAVVPSDLVSKTPPSISDEEAASIPLGSVTAAVGLFRESGRNFPLNGPTAAGQTIVVLGGSSSVGQFAIQLARIAGFSTIITTASPSNKTLVLRIGATHFVDRHSTSASTEIKSLVKQSGGAAITLVYDAISLPSSQALGVSVLDPNARDAKLLLVLGPDRHAQELNAQRSYPAEFKHVFGSGHQFREVSGPFWKNVSGWIERGVYFPNVVEVIPGGLKTGLQIALDKNKEGVSGVKLVVRPQEGLE